MNPNPRSFSVSRHLALLIIFALLITLGFIASGLAMRYARELAVVKKQLQVEKKKMVVVPAPQAVVETSLDEKKPDPFAGGSLKKAAYYAIPGAAPITPTRIEETSKDPYTYWVEIARPYDEMTPKTATAELWLVHLVESGSDAKKVGEYPAGECSGLEWNVTSEGGISLVSRDSVCEGGADMTAVTFDANGTQTSRIFFQTAVGDSFIFLQPTFFHGADIRVSLVTGGECEKAAALHPVTDMQAVGERLNPWPTTVLRGIRVTNTATKKSVVVTPPSELTMQCGEQYGGGVVTPWLPGVPVFKNGKIRFDLLGKDEAFVELDTTTNRLDAVSFSMFPVPDNLAG